jgi:hypothetical protein
MENVCKALFVASNLIKLAMQQDFITYGCINIPFILHKFMNQNKLAAYEDEKNVYKCVQP